MPGHRLLHVTEMRGVIVSSIAAMASAFPLPTTSRRGMVSLHGNNIVVRRSCRSNTMGIHEVPERPPDPSTLLSASQLQQRVDLLLEWFQDKKNVLCLSGAGLSTESGIPDYRGHKGSYHRGHKPMVHDQFMTSEYQRKRYWGRSLVGWRDFDQAQPNAGHYALADLEKLGKIGVNFEDKPEFYDPERAGDVHMFSGHQKISLVTQNVDSLHRRAGSVHLTELHGRNDSLRCTNCGATKSRKDFQLELESLNEEWLAEALRNLEDSDLRADGDAEVRNQNYDLLQIPNCKKCGGGFFKPRVVFFGDSVPQHRVSRVGAAFDAADGIFVVGSSLAVHSAYRHVRAASERGVPIALLNVGETRPEREGLRVLKIEAPAGPTLGSIVSHYLDHL